MLKIDSENIIGKQYGKLLVIKEVNKFIQPSGQTQRAFLCKCDCGNSKTIRLSHLRGGRIKSCGCLKPIHNMSGTHLHNIWRGMRYRCYGNNTIQPHLYKDRGIKVCDKWQDSFIKFNDWAVNNGYKHGLQIDRVDNDKGYYPDNCRFVTAIENSNNRRVTFKVVYKNKEYAFCDLLRIKGVFNNYSTIRARIKRGWDIKTAIDTPVEIRN